MYTVLNASRISKLFYIFGLCYNNVVELTRTIVKSMNGISAVGFVFFFCVHQLSLPNCYCS